MSIEKDTTILQDFENQLPSILNHILEGEIKKGKSIGIHFFQPEKHQIIEILKEKNKNGVWEAFIQIRHPKTNTWVKKEKASTFFPMHWTYEQLVEKLKIAFVNKKRKYVYQYIGKTDCGVKVIFFLKNNLVVSCFPKY
jgi:hypothetical protein